ncbi:MAG TPA: hypothetical protein VFG04_11300 [Planctomycetaceae bacterium]|jgi:hypothetical protein|nr:hypothetical protein [Planctomycetaceae bacterium]
MKRSGIAVCALVLVAIATSLRADEIDPSGIWKWVDDPTRESIETNELTLKREGNQLTGSLFKYNSEFPRLAKSAQNQIRRNITRKISDGTIQDGEISFKIVRSFNGRKSVTTYTGKVEGNLLKGKIGSGKNARDWEATKQ